MTYILDGKDQITVSHQITRLPTMRAHTHTKDSTFGCSSVYTFRQSHTALFSSACNNKVSPETFAITKPLFHRQSLPVVRIFFKRTFTYRCSAQRNQKERRHQHLYVNVHKYTKTQHCKSALRIHNIFIAFRMFWKPTMR